MFFSFLYVLLSGIALPVGGIQMQYLWRNQLGDVYSLGLGSAACLGAAAATMSGWCSLTVGSFICTLICTAPTGDLLKQYYLWGAANFHLEGVTHGDIIFSLCLFAIGLGAALYSARDLSRHFRGEIELSRLYKAMSLMAIMFLVTSAVSICGTIGFISLGVPNISRTICKSSDIRKHYLISSGISVGLLLVTYLVSEYANFGIYLPISATMAIIALPLMIFLFTSKGTPEKA